MKVPDENASRPFMSFTLNAPSTPILIQQYAEEHIKPRLANIPGIYKVELSGATPMEWRLEYDSEQLRLLGVTLSDISEAVQRHYRKEFLGTHNVDTGNGSREWIRLALVPESNSLGFNPAAITVTATDGKLLRLDELVSAVRMEEEPQSYYRINGLNSVYLSITAEETANQLQLNRAVMDEMEAVRQVLPVGYEVHTSYDATEYIREELDKIYFRTGLTVLILLVFVWLITRKLKYLFLIVTSLAVNIAVALIFYYLFGLEMQLYSLAGITVSLNLVIDSTIVMTDHILHRRNLKAFLSVLAATLTTMGALVIIFFLDEKDVYKRQLPVCLYQWLTKRGEILCSDRNDGRRWKKVMDKAGTMVAGGVMLLILCVLPAGMSRSAWLAAGVSCLCVYAWHMDWTDKFRLLWQQQRQRVVMVVVGGFCVLLLAGYLLFVLKPDSARGRLFMWKITCRAIAEKPLTGYGIHNFAAAYGNAQETYFAAGDYEPWEERVAGSPEYAFNEYLQAAVELGIPLAVCLLAVSYTHLMIVYLH